MISSQDGTEERRALAFFLAPGRGRPAWSSAGAGSAGAARPRPPQELQRPQARPPRLLRLRGAAAACPAGDACSAAAGRLRARPARGRRWLGRRGGRGSGPGAVAATSGSAADAVAAADGAADAAGSACAVTGSDSRLCGCEGITGMGAAGTSAVAAGAGVTVVAGTGVSWVSVGAAAAGAAGAVAARSRLSWRSGHLTDGRRRAAGGADGAVTAASPRVLAWRP